MEQNVSKVQKKTSNKTRGGGNASQPQAHAPTVKADAAGRRTAPSSARKQQPSTPSSNKPPPYQPPSYSQAISNPVHHQMQSGYQASPGAMPQTVSQPLQITLQIQQPRGYFIPPGMYQPPPFGGFPYMSVAPPATGLQPQGGCSVRQQQAFKNNATTAKVGNEVSSRKGSGRADRPPSVSSVCSEEKFMSRGDRGQRGGKSHCNQRGGRGQPSARGRGRSTGGDASSVHANPNSHNPDPQSTYGNRGRGAYRNQSSSASFNLQATDDGRRTTCGTEYDQTVFKRGQHRGRGEWSNRRGTRRFPGNVDRCQVESAPSNLSQRGHVTHVTSAHQMVVSIFLNCILSADAACASVMSGYSF